MFDNFVNKHLEKKYFTEIFNTVKETLNALADDFTVQTSFGRKWFTNTLANMDPAEETTAILQPVRKAVITAAGPSLEKSLENFPAIEENIICPTLKALRDEGSIYRGLLYCGLMITNEGPKVIEYNCRFGDPETQAVLPLLKTDFMDVCRAVLDEKVDQLSLNWKPETAVCVVLASSGYPVKYEKGYEIHLNTTPDSKLFYAGVGSIDEKLITNGGRVLNVVGIAWKL